MDTGPVDTSGSGWTWDMSQATPLTHVISNPYAVTMTLTLGAWSDGHYHWSTSSPLTIAPGASANLTVNWTGTAAGPTGTASVDWSLAGLGGGTIVATGLSRF